MKTNIVAHFTWIWCVCVVAALVGVMGAPTASAAGEKLWPVDGPVTRAFHRPPQPWLSGHRGIDIAAEAGTTVVAAAAGTVTWVGVIAGVPSISVTHLDGLKTTYQPVVASVITGQKVAAGVALGTLQSGHAAHDCLHFGLLRGSEYLDPLLWLSGVRNEPVRLLPVGATMPDAGSKSRLHSA